MPNFTHDPESLTAAQVREIALSVGHEFTAVRVRAVRNLIADKGGFEGALRWAYGNTAQQVARDVRAVWSGLYDDHAAVRRNLEALASNPFGLSSARESAKARLAVMDGHNLSCAA